MRRRVLGGGGRDEDWGREREDGGRLESEEGQTRPRWAGRVRVAEKRRGSVRRWAERKQQLP